jgi:hypothetical protein
MVPKGTFLWNCQKTPSPSEQGDASWEFDERELRWDRNVNNKESMAS